MGERQSRSILGHRAAFALLAALACALGALVLPLFAEAAVPFENFEVNSDGDGNKTAAGNVCEAAPGECTLRAALDAADANVGLSEIIFWGQFDGTEATAINFSSSNPVLAFTSTESEVSELTIVGGGRGPGCVSAAARTPFVGRKSSPSNSPPTRTRSGAIRPTPKT